MKGWWSVVGRVVRREVGRIVHRRLYRALLTVLPLGAMLFFVALFGSGGVHDLPLALIDRDHTPLSRQLATMIEMTAVAAITHTPTSTDEALQLIRRGRVRGLVVIPAGFERSVLVGRTVTVGSWLSGANLTTNGLLAADLQQVVQTLSVATQLERFAARGVAADAAMAEAMPIRFERHILFNPYINYGYYLAPSFMAMMLLIFTLMATIYAVGTELREGSAAQWLATAEGRMGAALIGKCLPVALAMQLVGVGMVVLLVRVVGVPLNGSVALLLLATTLLIAAYQAISILLVAVTRDLRLALSLGGGYGVLAFTLSGLTFPRMAMVRPMVWLGELFPFTPYTDLLLDQLLRGAPPATALRPLGQLLLFAVVPLVAVPRLERACRDAICWYKI